MISFHQGGAVEHLQYHREERRMRHDELEHKFLLTVWLEEGPSLRWLFLSHYVRTSVHVTSLSFRHHVL